MIRGARYGKVAAMGFVMIGVVALLLKGCDEDDGGGLYACSYEKSTTDGCDGYGFGPWEPGCVSINADDYYISPEEVCGNITDGGQHCQAGCCVSARYQNVHLDSGGCDLY